MAPSWVPSLAPVPAYNYFSNQLLLTLPIYSGGKLENIIDQAKLGQKISDLNFDAVKQQLKLEVTIGYSRVLHTSNLLEIARQTVNDFTGHLKNVQAQYDAGVVPLPDLLHTKVKLANAQDGLIKAENNYNLAVYNLNNIMGLPLREELKLKDDFKYQSYSLSLGDCIEYAFTNRPEVIEAQTNIAVKQDDVKIAQSNSLPALNLIGSNALDDTEFPGGKNSKWQVGLNVEMNVFDSGRTKSQVRRAVSSVNSAQERAQKIKDGVSLEVSSAFLSMKEAEKRIETNFVAVNQRR